MYANRFAVHGYVNGEGRAACDQEDRTDQSNPPDCQPIAATAQFQISNFPFFDPSRGSKKVVRKIEDNFSQLRISIWPEIVNNGGRENCMCCRACFEETINSQESNRENNASSPFSSFFLCFSRLAFSCRRGGVSDLWRREQRRVVHV
ncbi:MAG: hypothetical protein ACOX9C_07105 [Kiritimatiellia bacterium]